MGSRTRREREKENMRISILEAATKIIIEEGYDNLSMRRLADAIEYTPTTIYSYYKDKAQIVDDIVFNIYMEILSNIKKTLEDNENLSADKQLELCCKEFINTMVSKPEMGKAVIMSGTEAMFGPHESGALSEEHGVYLLKNLLQKGQQQSVLRELDENVSWMIISALIGFSINAIQSKLYLDGNFQRLVEIYTEILINGVLSKESIYAER